MARDGEVFHFEDGRPNFESYSLENGGPYWRASDLMEWLGYENGGHFRQAINKAMAACATLNISIQENFKEVDRDVAGTTVHDFKLTRFGCYLVAMNGDVRKEQVAKAQAYFATVTDAFRHYIQNAENVERVVIREEVSDREKTLSGVAAQAGVAGMGYALFQNAGYRGLYNMNLSTLRRRKGVEGSRSLLDFMGREELAANLFRITQTEAKIRNEKLRGQTSLESAAETVGRKVRRTMIEVSGTPPENLSITKDVREVRSHLKKTHREFTKMDKPARRKGLPVPSAT